MYKINGICYQSYNDIFMQRKSHILDPFLEVINQSKEIISLLYIKSLDIYFIKSTLNGHLIV